MDTSITGARHHRVFHSGIDTVLTEANYWAQQEVNLLNHIYVTFMIGSINPRTTNDWAGEGTWKGTTQGLGENVGLLPLIRVQVVYMLNNYYLLTILIQNIHLLDINNKDYCLAWRHVRCVIPTELSRDPVSNWCLTTSPFLKEQTSGMFTMLNLEGLLTLQPLRVVTGGTTCDCTTISWSSMSCHPMSCPTHGGESAIAGPHNDNLCRNTFNTSAESSPCTQWIMALEGERDLITKGPLKVLSNLNLGSTLSITLSPTFNVHLYRKTMRLIQW